MFMVNSMTDLYNIYGKANCIIIHNDGKRCSYDAGTPEYSDLLAVWSEMIDGAHDMPAFGVSLNRYTVEELKGGLWVEFLFDGEQEINGMPFGRLLVSVNDAFSGFNIIRYNNPNGYDGRCYYLDLVGKNMADLATLMRKLTD